MAMPIPIYDNNNNNNHHQENNSIADFVINHYNNNSNNNSNNSDSLNLNINGKKFQPNYEKTIWSYTPDDSIIKVSKIN